MARQNQPSEKEIKFYLEIITFDATKYTMDHPDCTISSFMGHCIGTQRVNTCLRNRSAPAVNC